MTGRTPHAVNNWVEGPEAPLPGHSDGSASANSRDSRSDPGLNGNGPSPMSSFTSSWDQPPPDLRKITRGYKDEKVDEHPVPKASKRLVKVHPIPARNAHVQAMVEEHAKECGALDKKDEEDVEEHELGRFYRQRYNTYPTFRSTISWFWVVFEVVTILFFCTGIGLLLYYSFGLQASEAPTERRHETVYDNFNSLAHPLMLRRSVPEQTKADSNSTFVLPGQPYRWKLGQEDETALRDVEEMFRSLDYMLDIKTAYGLILAGALVLLLARVISLFAFQPRLSLIAGTLVRGTPDFLYYIFVLVTAGLMLAMMMSIVFGTYFEPLSTPSYAMLVVFQGVISEGELESGLEQRLTGFLSNQASHLAISDSDPSMNAASRALAYVLILIRPLIFFFLFVLVMSILAWPYAQLKFGARSSPSVKNDLAAILKWMFRVACNAQPSNEDIVELVEHLSSRPNNSKEGKKHPFGWVSSFTPFRVPTGRIVPLPQSSASSNKPDSGTQPPRPSRPSSPQAASPPAALDASKVDRALILANMAMSKRGGTDLPTGDPLRKLLATTSGHLKGLQPKPRKKSATSSVWATPKASSGVASDEGEDHGSGAILPQTQPTAPQHTRNKSTDPKELLLQSARSLTDALTLRPSSGSTTPRAHASGAQNDPKGQEHTEESSQTPQDVETGQPRPLTRGRPSTTHVRQSVASAWEEEPTPEPRGVQRTEIVPFAQDGRPASSEPPQQQEEEQREQRPVTAEAWGEAGEGSETQTKATQSKEAHSAEIVAAARDRLLQVLPAAEDKVHKVQQQLLLRSVFGAQTSASSIKMAALPPRTQQQLALLKERQQQGEAAAEPTLLQAWDQALGQLVTPFRLPSSHHIEEPAAHSEPVQHGPSHADPADIASSTYRPPVTPSAALHGSSSTAPSPRPQSSSTSTSSSSGGGSMAPAPPPPQLRGRREEDQEQASSSSSPQAPRAKPPLKLPPVHHHSLHPTLLSRTPSRRHTLPSLGRISPPGLFGRTPYELTPLQELGLQGPWQAAHRLGQPARKSDAILAGEPQYLVPESSALLGEGPQQPLHKSSAMLATEVADQMEGCTRALQELQVISRSLQATIHSLEPHIRRKS